MRRATMAVFLLAVGCRPHARADGAALVLPSNAADQARRYQLPRTPTGDTDRDGVLDRDDACPAQLEFYDGRTDLDGCPEGGHEGSVTVDESTGVLELGFGNELEFGDDDRLLEWRHEETLRQVAFFLRAHPRFTRIEIEQRGDVPDCEGFDCDRHAESVRFFLVAHGVAEDRVRVRPGFHGMSTQSRDDDHVFARGPTSRVELEVFSASGRASGSR